MKLWGKFILGFAGALMVFSVNANTPETLLDKAGVKSEPNHLSDSVLIIIDAQREYVDGKLKLSGIDASLKEASDLLIRARKAGTPVIHVVHKAKPGSALFNPDEKYVEIADSLTPVEGEIIVTKTLPNSFAGTNLEEALVKTGRKKLIVIGFMTHMCVSTTVRAALDKGYKTTVVGNATATRDLAKIGGGKISAAVIQAASLAELNDRFASIVNRQSEILE